MSTILHEPTTEEAVHIKYVINQYLEEMRRLNVLMDDDQAQIETLRAETRMIANQTRISLVSLRDSLAKLETL